MSNDYLDEYKKYRAEKSAVTTTSEGWLDVGAATDIPAGQRKTFTHEQLGFVVLHEATGWFAIKDLCPHADVLLSGGTVADGVITCPGHNWQFRLDDGECVHGAKNCQIRTFPVRVIEGRVQVQIQ